MTTPLISIRNLCVDYITDAGDVRACNNVSFDLAPARCLALRVNPAKVNPPLPSR